MLPRAIAPQTLNGLKDNIPAYETSKALIAAHNMLVASLSPGTPVGAGDFTVSQGMFVTAISGTFMRGKVTLTCTPAIGTNPQASLRFPDGLFSAAPFATLVNNGSTGTLGFSYTESTTALLITILGHPVAGSTYILQWSLRD